MPASRLQNSGTEAMVEKQSISLARAPRWAFWLVSVYVVFLALLPASNIGGINVKVPVFAALTLAALLHSLYEEHYWVRLAAISAIVAVFTGWLLLTFSYPFAETSLALQQYRDVLTTLAGCWFIRLFTQHPSDRLSLARLVLYAIAFESLIKVVLFFYSMHSGIPISAISDRISALFGVQLMTADLGGQSVRLQLVSDDLLPSAVLRYPVSPKEAEDQCLRLRYHPGSVTGVLDVHLLALFLGLHGHWNHSGHLRLAKRLAAYGLYRSSRRSGCVLLRAISNSDRLTLLRELGCRF